MQIPAMIAAFRTSVDNNLTTTPTVDTIDIYRRERTIFIIAATVSAAASSVVAAHKTAELNSDHH